MEKFVAGTMAFEGLVRVHGHGMRCCPSRGWSWRGWESSSIKKKEKGKVEICWENQKTLPKRAWFSLFCDTFFIAGVLLGQSQLQWLQVFLGIWQHFDFAAHLAGPNKLKKWLAWFLKIHGFQDFLFHPKKRISFSTESRHHDNISAWPGAGSGSGFGDYVGPRLLFLCCRGGCSKGM